LSVDGRHADEEDRIRVVVQFIGHDGTKGEPVLLA